MKRSKWLVLLAMLFAFSMVAAACGNDDEPKADDGGSGGTVEKFDVSVYFQGALTGPYNYLVVPSFQGAQLAIDELNADPDFPATIELKKGDTQGSGDAAPPVLEEVTGDETTVAVIGPGFSGESAVSGDTYNDSQIPFISPSATNTALADEGWEYWYRGVGNDASQGGIAGEFIAKTIKPAKLFIAHDKSEYGQPLAETVQTTAEDAGVEVVGFEGIEAGQEDYSSLVSTVKSSGADFMFFGGYDADFGKIVKQARDEGVDIGIMSGDGSLSSTTLDLAGADATDVYLIAPTNIGGEFVSKYNDEVGGDASSVPVYAAEGYDVANLIGNGIKDAVDNGATGDDVQAIRDGIKAYFDGLIDDPYQGEAKPYAFDEKHEIAADDPKTLFYLYKVVDGELTQLGSAEELLGEG
jgi:branched-chain amino acid transport system substrate-binding protein